MDNVYDIKRAKNLNYILPVNTKLNRVSSDLKKGKAAVCIHLHYLDTIETYLKYMEMIPDSIDIFVTFSNNEVKEVLQKAAVGSRKNCRFINKQNRGRDISAFLVACRRELLQYEYICFLHDKKEKKSIYKKDTDAWIRCLWENMLGSEEYIDNILSVFLENSALGLLTPPYPVTEHFSTFYMYAWGRNFDITKELSERMKLKCNLDIAKPPVTLGTVFWARTAALKKLFEIEWEYESFDQEPLKEDGTLSHAIERILAYVAQDAGFDSGWVMTDQYAGVHFENMQHALKTAFNKLNSALGISWIGEIDSYESKVQEMLSFVKKHEELYIYGAGNYGMRCLAMLRNGRTSPTAFLVSDSSNNPKDIQGIPVYSIKEVELNPRCGIVVGVAEAYREDVIQAIRNKSPEFSNIYLWK